MCAHVYGGLYNRCTYTCSTCWNDLKRNCTQAECWSKCHPVSTGM